MPSIEDAHAALLRDGAFQFTMPNASEPPPAPPWHPALGFGGVGTVWVLAAAAAALIVVSIVSYLRGREPSAGRPTPEAPRDAPPVSPAAARLALGDADGLAARGLHLEAVRALLGCGIDAIAERHPGLLRPATTSRDLARASALPEATRLGFARIARAVELGLFGGRPVAAEDYAECRRAFVSAAFSPGSAPA